jgi:hypothetical protein
VGLRAADPGELKGNPFHWQCYQCAKDTSYRFSHITGTIFENTNKPLRDWFKVIYLMLTSKKGMSALQIRRYMGFGSYKTAWLMCHKIRTALMQDIEKLGGIVRAKTGEDRWKMQRSESGWPNRDAASIHNPKSAEKVMGL